VVLHLVHDSVRRAWLRDRFPGAIALLDAYRPGRPARAVARDLVERILAPVRRGQRVCAAFDGHPLIEEIPAAAALAQARSEGFETEALAGVSAIDAMFADLELEETASGWQCFEAADLLACRRRIDPRVPLVVLQAGSLGVSRIRRRPAIGAHPTLRLARFLARAYPPDSPIVLYESAPFAALEPRIERTTLRALPAARVGFATTLYVPPHLASPRGSRARRPDDYR
jgi:hypothetical protein